MSIRDIFELIFLGILSVLFAVTSALAMWFLYKSIKDM